MEVYEDGSPGLSVAAHKRYEQLQREGLLERARKFAATQPSTPVALKRLREETKYDGLGTLPGGWMDRDPADVVRETPLAAVVSGLPSSHLWLVLSTLQAIGEEGRALYLIETHFGGSDLMDADKIHRIIADSVAPITPEQLTEVEQKARDLAIAWLDGVQQRVKAEAERKREEEARKQCEAAERFEALRRNPAPEIAGAVHISKLRERGIEPDWIVPGLVARGELTLVAAKHKVGKSFMVLDAALCAATGLPWFGAPGKQIEERRVMLIIGEGEDELPLRETAWREHRGYEGEARLHVINGAMLDEPGVVEQIVADIKEAGVEIDLIVVDPIASTMAGSEITGMSNYINRVRYLAQALNAGVLLIHHLNANGDLRGHTSLPAAVNRAIELSEITGSQGEIVKVAMETLFTRRGRAGAKHVITMQEVELDGETTLVVTGIEPSNDTAKAVAKLSARHDAFDAELIRLIRSGITMRKDLAARMAIWLQANEGVEVKKSAVGHRIDRRVGSVIEREDVGDEPAFRLKKGA